MASSCMYALRATGWCAPGQGPLDSRYALAYGPATILRQQNACNPDRRARWPHKVMQMAQLHAKGAFSFRNDHARYRTLSIADKRSHTRTRDFHGTRISKAQPQVDVGLLAHCRDSMSALLQIGRASCRERV